MGNRALGLLAKTRTTLEMIKWEHSIFALPFALTATLLAARGFPGWRTLGWILVCHGHRSLLRHGLQPLGRRRTRCSQSPNKQPRHSRRAALAPVRLGVHDPDGHGICFGRGRIEPADSLLVAGRSCGAAWLQLHEALYALVASGTWAWRSGSHPPPRGSPSAALLIHASLSLLRQSLSGSAGFDVLYACQDFDHDRAAGLHSLPQAVGIPAAFWAARAMHVAMLCLLVLVWRCSLLDLPDGSALPLRDSCWPMNTRSFLRATCAASMPPSSP